MSTVLDAPAIVPSRTLPHDPVDDQHLRVVLTGAGPSFDPRTKLASLLVLNAVVYSGASDLVIVCVVALSAILLVVASRPRAALVVLVAAAGLRAAAHLPVLLGASTAMAFLVLLLYWIERFVSIGAVVYWAFSTTRVGHFAAALAAIHCPRGVLVPLMVMLRYIPTVASELRAIVEAMRLRGVMPTGLGALVHPMRTTEHLLVPLLASTTRMADDMTASGLVRGLGLPTRPTTITRLGFSPRDLLLVMALIAIVALRWYEVDWSTLHAFFV